VCTLLAALFDKTEVYATNVAIVQ